VVGRPQVPSRGGHGLQLTRTRSAGGTIPTITGGASRAPAVPGRTLRGLWCWQLGDECRTFDGGLSGSIERAVMPAPRGRSRGRRSRSCDGRCGVDVEELGGDVEGCELGCISTRRACSMAGRALHQVPPGMARSVRRLPGVSLRARDRGGDSRFRWAPDLHPSQSTTSPDPAERRRLLLHAGGAWVPQPAAYRRRSDYTSVRGVWCHPSSCRGDTRVTRTN
jgi:hypothetical protein